MGGYALGGNDCAFVALGDGEAFAKEGRGFFSRGNAPQRRTGMGRHHVAYLAAGEGDNLLPGGDGGSAGHGALLSVIYGERRIGHQGRAGVRDNAACSNADPACRFLPSSP